VGLYLFGAEYGEVYFVGVLGGFDIFVLGLEADIAVVYFKVRI
jgi:hypothetical protein